MGTKKMLTIEEMESVAKMLSEPKYKQAIDDLSIEMSEPVPVLKQGDYVIFSRGNISTIGGKAKSRKTFLIVLFAADFLENSETGKVLIVDTEMAKVHTRITHKRIHRMMGWDTKQNHERLTVLSLREYAPADRAAIFKEAIEQLRPELIFLDGVRDIVKDFNSVDESTLTVGLLMKLSTEFDCHICSVLHENKGNGQLRGHLGTEVINKSETVLSVTNNGDTSTVEPVYTRNMPFDAFAFRINDDALPEYCDTPIKSAKVEKIRNVFEAIFSDGITLSYSDLRSKVMETENIKISAAQIRISDAVSFGIIIKDQSGGYYFPKSISDENTIPF